MSAPFIQIVVPLVGNVPDMSCVSQDVLTSLRTPLFYGTRHSNHPWVMCPVLVFGFESRVRDDTFTHKNQQLTVAPWDFFPTASKTPRAGPTQPIQPTSIRRHTPNILPHQCCCKKGELNGWLVFIFAVCHLAIFELQISHLTSPVFLLPSAATATLHNTAPRWWSGGSI